MSKEPETRALRRSKSPSSGDVPTTCSICGEAVRPEDADLHILAEDWVIEAIRKTHPEWVEVDGACPRCIDLYRKL